MTARTLAAACFGCVLLTGCAQLWGQKQPEGFTTADRKFFKEAEAQIDGNMAPTPTPTPAKQAENFVAMGQFYLETKKTSLAVRMFDKAITANPKNIAAYAGLAKCHAEAGETQQAAEAINKGFAVDSKSPVLWNEAAVLRAKTGDLDGAVEAAEKACKAAPGMTLYAENLGNMLAMSGRYRDAIEVYSKALNPAEAHYRVGLVMRGKGDVRNGELHLKQALTINPDHAAARRALMAAGGAAPAQRAPVQRAAYEAPEDADSQVVPAAAPAPRRVTRFTSNQQAPR